MPRTVRLVLNSYALTGIKVELSEGDPNWHLTFSEERATYIEDEEDEDDDGEKEDDVGEDDEDEENDDDGEKEDDVGEDDEDEEDDDDYEGMGGYRPFWSDSPEASGRGQDGSDGFLALLSELAPHIEEPLVLLVLVVETEDHLDWNAEVFVVQPGQTEVKTLLLNHP